MIIHKPTFDVVGIAFEYEPSVANVSIIRTEPTSFMFDNSDNNNVIALVKTSDYDDDYITIYMQHTSTNRTFNIKNNEIAITIKENDDYVNKTDYIYDPIMTTY